MTSAPTKTTIRKGHNSGITHNSTRVWNEEDRSLHEIGPGEPQVPAEAPGNEPAEQELLRESGLDETIDQRLDDGTQPEAEAGELALR